MFEVNGHRTQWFFVSDTVTLPAANQQPISSQSAANQRASQQRNTPCLSLAGVPHEGCSWRVADLDGKGCGIIATRNIHCGERILADRPLAIVTQQGGSSPIGVIQRVVDALTPSAKKAFFGLSQNHFKYGAVKTAEGIWRTNAYPIFDQPSGRKVAAVFAHTCRINHACSPNAHVAWNKELKRHTVHATRPITAGSEITVSCTQATRKKCPSLPSPCVSI